MRKFVLSLFVLLMAGALFAEAVASDPSNIVGYYQYGCVEGLNLVALPFSGAYTNVSEIFAAYQGKVSAIYLWNAATQDWVEYEDGDTAALANFSVMMLQFSEAADFFTGGSLVTNMNTPIVAGYNALIVPFGDETNSFGHYIEMGNVGNDVPNATLVSRWLSDAQEWLSIVRFDNNNTWEEDHPVHPGMPLFVTTYLGSEATWPPIGE